MSRGNGLLMGLVALPDLNISPDLLDNLRRRQIIGKNIEICVLSGVPEPTLLLTIICFGPVQFPAQNTNRKGRIQEDQDLGVGQAAPHIGDIGVLLGDGLGADSQCPQPGCDRRFSRSAHTDKTYEWIFVRGGFHNLDETISIRNRPETRWPRSLIEG